MYRNKFGNKMMQRDGFQRDGFQRDGFQRDGLQRNDSRRNSTRPEGNVNRKPKHDDIGRNKDSRAVRQVNSKGDSVRDIKTILNDVQENVTVIPKDPTSPLFSVKKFDELNLKPLLLKGIYAMGFNTPSKIQELALPLMLKNPPQNLIAQSQSGTGKSAAFILAMISRVDVRLNYPQVLCLTPTFELAIQIGEVAMRMTQFCSGITFRYAVSGESLDKEQKLTEHIVIGTPGKSLDWGIKWKHFDLEKIKVFVLDEADIMIDTHGHQDQCLRLHKCLRKECQILFFSATYSIRVTEFAKGIVPIANKILLKSKEQSLDWIKQYYIVCDTPEIKYKSIENIYAVVSIGQMIIFCNSRNSSNFLYRKMSEDGHAVVVLSGELTVSERLKIIDNFRAGLVRVLIATNVLSRGIDVQQVTVVVNYDMPISQRGFALFDVYLHRIGRTGRFGHNGIAINLISQSEIEGCKSFEKHFQKVIKLLDIDDINAVEELNEKEEDEDEDL